MDVEGVVRLVDVAANAIEPVGSGEAIQYDGGMLPVVRVAETLVERRGPDRLPPAQARPTDEVAVIVCRSTRGPVGLIVDHIGDIVEAFDEAVRPPSRDGVVETRVLEGRITEVLDIETFAALAHAARVTR